MTNIDKSKDSIFQKGFGWTYVGAEMAAKHNREINAFVTKMHDRGKCVCPRNCKWYCDQDCVCCRYHLNAENDEISDGIVSHAGRAAHKIYRNCSLDAPALDSDNSCETLGDVILAPDEPVDIATEKRDLATALLQAISELSPDDYEIIRLSFIEGLSDKQIAERLGIKARTTLSSRKIKIFRMLGEKIKDFF